MSKAREPVLFISIYLHRQTPKNKDPRVAILRQVDSFVKIYKLQVPEDSKALHTKISEIDLRAVDGLPDSYVLLFSAEAGFSARLDTGYEAIIYAYHDSIIAQLQITKFENWEGSVKTGWRELVSALYAGFDTNIAATAGPSVFGLSAVYWFISDHKVHPESDTPDLGLEGRFAGCTQTDIGPLWSCEYSLLKANVHQDLWVLATSKAKEPVNAANIRYYHLADGPPPFGEIALARH